MVMYRHEDDEKKNYKPEVKQESYLSIDCIPSNKMKGWLPFDFSYHYFNLGHLGIIQVIHVYVDITNQG